MERSVSSKRPDPWGKLHRYFCRPLSFDHPPMPIFRHLEESDANFCYRGDPVEENPSLFNARTVGGSSLSKEMKDTPPKESADSTAKEKTFSGRCFDGMKEESGSETRLPATFKHHMGRIQASFQYASRIRSL